MEISVETKIENIDTVTDFVNEFLESIECPMKMQIQLDIIVDELLGNIIRYAYTPNIGEAVVQIECSYNPKTVILTFVDEGIPYNPLMNEDPDVKLSIDEREIGGLGIFMVKKSADDIFYEYKNGKNVLCVKKIIE